MLLFIALLASPSQAGVVVIVNAENTASDFSQRQLVDLYMGRNLYFPNGQLALRLDQSPSSEIRRTFYESLVGKSVAQVNAYWARLLFTGRASPPQVIRTSKGLLQAIKNNPNAVGYIDEKELEDGVKVIARVN
ncbi:hypothetical protein A9Q99_12935 [Gammaproteobacteria bacterium 45_16_T64]|nr:hypothetical protein A9Q99_12935 [Gammaproteobacteria bacterium 45_16_T64]